MVWCVVVILFLGVCLSPSHRQDAGSDALTNGCLAGRPLEVVSYYLVVLCCALLYLPRRLDEYGKCSW